MTFLYHKL